MTFREPITNVGPVCQEHAPKPLGLTGDDVKHFVGRSVKLGFPCGDEPADFSSKHPDQDWPEKEHMWVEVTQVIGSHLTGRLDNDPFFCPMEHGTEVRFTADEIEEVFAD